MTNTMISLVSCTAHLPVLYLNGPIKLTYSELSLRLYYHQRCMSAIIKYKPHGRTPSSHPSPQHAFTQQHAVNNKSTRWSVEALLIGTITTNLGLCGCARFDYSISHVPEGYSLLLMHFLRTQSQNTSRPPCRRRSRCL